MSRRAHRPSRFAVPHSVFAEDMPECAFTVLIYLHSTASAGGQCSPGIKQIARETRYSEPSIKRAIALLQKRKWFFNKRRMQGGRNMLIFLQEPPHLRPKTPCADGGKVVKFRAA